MAGLGLTGAEYSFTGAYSIGNNFQLYANGWGGNQYVSTFNVGELAHDLGAIAGVAAFVTDTVGFVNGDIGGLNYATNTGVGAVGMFGGPIGAAAAGGYFLVDTFYPHLADQSGAGALMVDYAQGQQQQLNIYQQQMAQTQGHPFVQATLTQNYIEGTYGVGFP